jgi:hypothetical protein
MRRRKVLAGLGSLAAGGAAVMGTGAISSTQANRTFSVSTSGDASAELGLEGANDEYVTDDGVDGQLEITLGNLNPNAVTGINELFTITNNTDHSLDVWGEPSGPHADDVVFVRNGYTNDSQATLRQSDAPTISADSLNAESDNAAVAYTNGRVGGDSGGRVEFSSGKEWSFAMIVDTRGISSDQTILNNVTIYADNFDNFNDK